MRQNIQKVVDFYYSNYYEAVHSPLHSYSKLSFHAQLESAHSSLIKYPIVLELGAGNSNHIKFVKHRFDTYLLSDVRKIKNDEIPEARSGVIPNRPGIYKSIIDAKILPYPNESVDRIVSGCLLLHIEDPLNALEEWLRVLKAGGVIDTFIPNDQSLLVRLYRIFYSRRKSRKLGFYKFDLVNAFEHKTYYERIFCLINAAFVDLQFEFQHYPPLLGSSRYLRAYSILRVRKH